MRQIICYKVLTRNLMSIVKDTIDFPYSIQYRIGEFVKPSVQGSSIFVFDTLENAKKFESISCVAETIFECVGINPHKILTYQINSLSHSETLANWVTTCKKRYQHKKFLDKDCIKSTPIGTIGVDSLKLVRIVFPSNLSDITSRIYI